MRWIGSHNDEKKSSGYIFNAMFGALLLPAQNFSRRVNRVIFLTLLRAIIPGGTFVGILTVVFPQNTIKVRCMF